MFPLDRLRELARERTIGSVADTHYSFMGATDPVRWSTFAREVAGRQTSTASIPAVLRRFDRSTRAVSALGHYLEEEGIASVAISLIRPRDRDTTPRALWVPFELGRPFGPPCDGAFQKRVLLAALRSSREPSGDASPRPSFPAATPAPARRGRPPACPKAPAGEPSRQPFARCASRATPENRDAFVLAETRARSRGRPPAPSRAPGRSVCARGVRSSRAASCAVQATRPAPKFPRPSSALAALARETEGGEDQALRALRPSPTCSLSALLSTRTNRAPVRQADRHTFPPLLKQRRF